jgi:NADPH:quinone reductase
MLTPRLCQGGRNRARSLERMRAVICDRYQGIDALRVGDAPEPEPARDEVLVEVGAATVNFADTLMVAGEYQVKPELPFVPGSEFAGTVIRPDAESRFRQGERVIGFVGFGAMAERVVAHPNHLMTLPDAVSLETGACLPVAYGTAYHALVDRARLVEGESLLVLGAAGGVGIAATEIGKKLGARVIAAVSSEEKEAAVRMAGADGVIRYDMTPLREGIQTHIGGSGVDVVFDPVGGATTEQALRSTGWNGRLLVIGFASGQIPSIPLNLSLVKGNSIVGVFWGRFNLEQPEKSTANNEKIMAWIADGSLSPIVQRTFPLDEAANALRWVAERNVVGRVLIEP